MTGEARIRDLASQDATLQSFFGTNPFRWFHVQLPPNYVMPATDSTCVRFQVVSSRYLYAQEARVGIFQQYVSITVLDRNADQVDAAAAAIVDWLGKVDFSTDDQFVSPVVTPRQHPNFVVNVRPGAEVQLKPPIPTQTIDAKIWNKATI